MSGDGAGGVEHREDAGAIRGDSSGEGPRRRGFVYPTAGAAAAREGLAPVLGPVARRSKDDRSYRDDLHYDLTGAGGAGAGGDGEADASVQAALEVHPGTVKLVAEVGGDVAVEDVAVRNAGGAPVRIEDVMEVPGDGTAAGEFLVFGVSGGVAIEPGERTRFQVGFRPRPGASDRRRAALHILTDGGVRSATVQARGIADPTTQATLDRRRRDAIVADARGDGAPAPPQGYADMLDHLRAAVELLATGEHERAAVLVEAVYARLDEVAAPHMVSARLGGYGFGAAKGAEIVGFARDAVLTMLRKIRVGGTVAGEYFLTQFQLAAEPLQLLLGETDDCKTLRAMDAAAYTTLGVLGGTAAAIFAAPLVLDEIATLYAFGRNIFAAVSVEAAASPVVAMELTALAASIGFSILDAGGVDAWLASVQTPEGFFFFVVEVAQTFFAARSAARPDADADGDGARESLDRIDAFLHDAERLAKPADPRAARRARAATELASIPVTVAPKPGASRGTYHVTQRDAERMSTLFAELDDIETIAFKDGLLVRHGGQEWYFELDDLAHAREGATTAQTHTAVHGVSALPESNVATVELWGFRGVRSIQKPGDATPRRPEEWTAAERAEVDAASADEPLIYAGHVGISFDGGKTIYGLTPEWKGKMALEEARARLANHEILPGIVGDDTGAFDQAKRGAEKLGWNTDLERAVVVFAKETQPKIVAEVERLRALPPGEVFGYRFPSRAPDEHGDYFEGGASYDGRHEYCTDNVSNCAVFPSKLGIPIPEPSGNMIKYMPELKKWAQADAPIDMRPKEPLP